MGIKCQVKRVKAINSFPSTQLEHNICLSLLPLLGLGGRLDVEKGSTLKPAKKPQRRERILIPLMDCGPSAEALGFSPVGRGRGMGSLRIQGALASLRGGGALVSPVNKV